MSLYLPCNGHALAQSRLLHCVSKKILYKISNQKQSVLASRVPWSKNEREHKSKGPSCFRLSRSRVIQEIFGKKLNTGLVNKIYYPRFYSI